MVDYSGSIVPNYRYSRLRELGRVDLTIWFPEISENYRSW